LAKNQEKPIFGSEDRKEKSNQFSKNSERIAGL